MACMEERTGGALTGNLFAGGQIASGSGALEAMKSGLAQISYVVPSALSDQLPLNNIPNLPDMGPTVADMVAAYRKVLQDGGPIKDELDANRIVPLVINMFPPYQVAVKGGRIETLDQFVSKKIRVQGGAHVAAVEGVGAVPVQISSGDAYVAMQQGTVDAIFLPLASLVVYSLQELSDAISTNANFAATAAIISIDKQVFDELPAEQQDALLACGQQVEASITKHADDLTANLAVQFADEGVDMYEFDAAELKKINDGLSKGIDEWLSRLDGLGLAATQAYQQHRAALGAE